MNQLLWYYADLEWIACLADNEAGKNETMRAVSGRKSSKVGGCSLALHLITFMLQMAYENKDGDINIEINHCLAYRKFAKYGRASNLNKLQHLSFHRKYHFCRKLK